MTWQHRAACRPGQHVNAALFDARLDGDTDEPDDERRERHRKAGAICQRCPVRDACKTDAINDTTAEGIRAGILFERNEP